MKTLLSPFSERSSTLKRASLLWAAVAMACGLALALAMTSLAGAQTPAAPLAQACADAYEVDDTPAQARPIAVNGAAQTHTFDPAPDVDWVTFPMTAGQRFTIFTSNLISKTDTVLNLYDTDGTTLLATNDDIAYPANIASRIITTAVRTGTYYARVSDYWNNGGCDLGYNLTVATRPDPLYFPFMASSSNLAISGLEVTQSVQRPDNSVPLVAGRRTMLRVYAYSFTGAPVSNVRVSVAATQNGVPLLGSPLVIGPQTAPTSPSRASLPGSFNVELPSNWLSGAVVITATAYQGSLPYPNSSSTSLTLNFNSVPTLNIKVVPIQYTAPGGQVYPAPSTDTISDWIMRAYPINSISLTFHASYPFSSGDLTQVSTWYTLLQNIYTLKVTEKAPASQVYFGLIPTMNGSVTWFTSGTSGLGYVGTRAAIGLELSATRWGPDATGQNTAHEIGHNLGRYHAPCGAVANPDPSYPSYPPYPSGSIGQFGLDIPKGVLWNPATTYDLMSYCDPLWVSDYTYQGLYSNQVAYGAAVLGASAPGLFIRGVFSSTDAVTLQPIYALSLPPSDLPASSDYQVELLDAQGQVVAAHPVPVLEADIDPGGGTFRSISAVVPRPAQPVATVRLVRAGQAVAEKAVAGAGVGVQAAPTVTRQPGGPITLTWSGAANPALVRYSADGGQTWTTLGVDVLGGEFTVDPATLPNAGTGDFEVTLAQP